VPWRSKHPLLTGHTRREPYFHVRYTVRPVVKISVTRSMSGMLSMSVSCLLLVQCRVALNGPVYYCSALFGALYKHGLITHFPGADYSGSSDEFSLCTRQ
jgi:hypothetical protein